MAGWGKFQGLCMKPWKYMKLAQDSYYYRVFELQNSIVILLTFNSKDEEWCVDSGSTVQNSLLNLFLLFCGINSLTISEQHNGCD